MLDEKRLKEAESNVRIYLAENKLKKVEVVDTNILNVLKNNSQESLKVANLLFSDGVSSLWTIVCSYYAMYYMANAVLYKLRYKVGHEISHKVTSDSLIVYVKDKIKKQMIEEYEEAKEEALELASVESERIIESFDLERMKRERFQYTTTESVKRGKAETSLKRAKSFIFEMEKLLL